MLPLKREVMSVAAEKSRGGKKEQAGPEREQQDHLFGEAEELFLVRIPVIILTAFRKRYVKKLLISALSMKLKENKMLILKDFPMEKISTHSI